MKARDFTDSPVLWFTTMEIESNKGNFEQAAYAKQQLERLGVFVRFKNKVRQGRLERAQGPSRRERPTVIAGAMP